MENDEIKIKADLLDTFLVKLKSRNDMVTNILVIYSYGNNSQ